MKAISLRSPWPWFVLHAGKDIENRGWTSSYRGPILIHASKGWDEDEVEADLDFCIDTAVRQGCLARGDAPSMDQLKSQRGTIIGVVDIVGSTLESDSPWFFGPKGFVLANPLPFLDPVPCRGDRGLFTPNEDVLSSCRAQIDLARSRGR